MDLTVALLASVALLIRVGTGWYAAGLSRSKNAAGAVLRNVADLAVATLVFWAVGGAIWNGDAGLAFDAKARMGAAQFVQLVLVLIAVAPVAGAAAERSRFMPMLVAPALLAAVVVPLAGQWVWRGWLLRLGYFDAAGASVLHVTGGLCAAAVAFLVGPRAGKYNRDGSSNFIPGHSLPMASVGVLLMLGGWVPYVLAVGAHGGTGAGGIGRAAINVLLAAAAGAVVAMLLTRQKYGKPDLVLTYAGVLGALVAVSAAGGAVPTIGAAVIGAVAGALVPQAVVYLDLVWKIDDPVGAVAIHALGGAWGTLAVALFGPAAGFGDRFRQLGVQLLGLAVIAGMTLALSLVAFALLKRTTGLRLSEDAEYDGVDLAEHDLNAYPDFQQTMIKSYHMREA